MMFANATTSTGRMRGRIEDGLAVFRGIPFAQPPVGEHRFATPRPALPWDGVRDAFAFGPQTPMGPSMPVVPEVSTDWLAVNVWPSHSRREASSGYLTFDTLPLL